MGVILFPASTAVTMAEKVGGWPTDLAVEQVHGRVWSGRMTGVAWQGEAVGDVHWQLRPVLGWNRQARADLRITGEDITARGQMEAGLGQKWRVEGVDGNLTLDFARQWLSRPLPATGHVMFEGVTLSGGPEAWQEAEGQLRWKDASLLMPNAMEAGEQRARLAVVDRDLEIRIRSAGDAAVQTQGVVRAKDQPGAGPVEWAMAASGPADWSERIRNLTGQTENEDGDFEWHGTMQMR
ncbi:MULTISPECIES: type II secretion system protein N [unclassified Thioalkalivibrio]|uniref:type II secretion system protein N n=1 Tax=unclassified Thioalkalivibrio TaxID=2621013 RepID=UPI00039A3F12|nr:MULTISPECIES: type II secretion system protein N [unclassified Thioalkalivibrio]